MVAAKKEVAIIKEMHKNPATYETIIVGTPILARTIPSPISTYISQYKKNFSRVVLFCTCDSEETTTTFY